MITGSRSLNLVTQSMPLPEVVELQPLYEVGVRPRQGQLIIVMGQPGAGKSTWVEWYVDKMDVEAIYFSADMDAADGVSRQIAMRSNLKTSDALDAINAGATDYVEEYLIGTKIFWVFDSGPSLTDIQQELDAYVELKDALPKVLIIDNAMNIEGESEDEQGGLRFVFKELHRLAHDTGICVIVLHHAREEGDARYPSPRGGLQGKVAQLPEIILSVALDGDQFRIAPVKVRSGKQDASGQKYITLTAEPERSQFRQYVPQVSYPTVEYGGLPQ